MSLHIHWPEQWAEVVALLFLVLGFFISALLHNPTFSYIIVFLCSFLAGRVFYMKRFSEPILPFVLIILGFLLGYLIGSFWVSRFWILVFFAIGFISSYYLHLKKILVIFKSKDWIK